MIMKTKNFEDFLLEDYTEEIAAPSEEVSADSETNEPSEETPTDAAPSGEAEAGSEMPIPMPEEQPTVPGMGDVGAKGSKALYIYGGVDSLNSPESPLLQAMNQLTTALDCCEPEIIKLYQLNIQPPSSDGAAEPADGMAFIYEKLTDSDVVVFVSPVQDGDVSSLTRTVLKRLAFHYKNMELKNKIYASLLIGDQNSQQLVKADLANQANNLGLIVGAGTTIFDVAQLQTLVQAVKEIKDATSAIRSAAPMNTTVPGVMNYDQFAGAGASATADLAQTGKAETDMEKPAFDVVSDTNAPAEGESETEEPAAETEGEETEGEETEGSETEGEETEGETEGEAEGEEATTEEEEELSRKQKKLPKHLLKAIMKSKHIKEEEEEIEETEKPALEAKNENATMKKIHHIARFSEMKTDKTKNEFVKGVDAKKMPGGKVSVGNLKKEVAPDQKLEKGKEKATTEIKPKPDSSAMKAGSGSPTAGAKSLGKEENGDVKPAKGETKKSVENFSNFTKKA